MRLSQKTNIPPSATVAMNARAAAKRARGESVYNLTVGEPVVTVDHVVTAGVNRALQEGKTGYAPAAGITELRSALAESLNHQYGSSYQKEEVMVAVGGKHAVLMALQSLIDDGDEAMIIAPYWVSYPPMVTLCGGIPVIVETNESDGWIPTREALSAQITDRTRVLIINSASNPTGALYPRGVLRDILALAAERGIMVIADEVYSGLTYDGESYVSAAAFPEYRDAVVIIGSASKNFGMTGARLGFAWGPEELIRRMTTLQGQSTTSPATILQWAMCDVIADESRIVSHMRETIETRRDAFLSGFTQYFGHELSKPQSALYSFVPLRDLGIENEDSVSCCTRVLEEANVAMVPGIAFGAEGYVRMSYGGLVEETHEALRRLSQYL